MSGDLASRMDEGFARMGELMEARFAQAGQQLEARFAQAGQQLEARFAKADQQLEVRFAEADQKLEVRFAQMDQNLEARFAQIDQRFAQVDQRFEKLEEAVNAQGILLERNTDDIRQLAEKIGTMEASFDTKLDKFWREIVVERLEPLADIVREHSRRLDGRP